MTKTLNDFQAEREDWERELSIILLPFQDNLTGLQPALEYFFRQKISEAKQEGRKEAYKKLEKDTIIYVEGDVEYEQNKDIDCVVISKKGLKYFIRKEISTLLDELKMEGVKPWQEMTEEWEGGYKAAVEKLNNKLNILKK